MENISQVKKTLETILFVASEPVTLKEMARLANVEETILEPILVELILDYGSRGLQVIKLAGGYQMATRAEFSDLVQKITTPVKDIRLSAAAIETLAIIAYRQPITHPEIEYLRGVDSNWTIDLLLERELIKDLGRKETVGRPILYGTTSKFLTLFGLKDLNDLPVYAS